MAQGLAGFLGGIGLFLFGMAVMTSALAELAGPGLRRRIAGATATRWRGALTGLAAASVLQSSTAVTLMAIGFVGAGVMTFQQSLGVILGANIGSTITGWLVTLVGVKLQLSTLAMAVLPAAALAVLLGGGRVARAGRVVAGLALVFLGLGTMQGAVSGEALPLTPEMLPQDGLLGRLALVGIGTVLAMILQSSNAGLALVVVVLGSGGVQLPQAAALVLGLNIGTTITGLIAATGGSREMRMTALANLMMNGATALALFPALGWLESLVDDGAGLDAQTLLVGFHSIFNLACTVLFLPLVGPFAALVTRLVRHGQPSPADRLDRRLAADPGAALHVGLEVAEDVSRQIGQGLGQALAYDLGALDALPPRLQPSLAALESWLSGLPALTDARDRSAHAALMHMTDHLTRLLVRVQSADRVARVAADRHLSRPVRAIAAGMATGADAAQMERLDALAQRRAHGKRHRFLAGGPTNGDDPFLHTDAMRWVERVADHAERIAHHRDAARHALR